MTIIPSTYQTLETILDGLMRRYTERVPDVQAVIDAMIDEGLIEARADIENDHIAFRTMGVEHLGIASLEKVFTHHGYEKRDPYNFERKKLNAFWYAPPEPRYPRIFISELRVGQLSDEAQAIIRNYTDEVLRDPVETIDLNDGATVDSFLHAPLWRTPTLADYQRLAQESEYAAWVIYNRYYLNHFTISVHNLPAGYNTIPEFNAFLERRGFQLNDANGKVKTSVDGKLRQSSTVAEMVTATFAEGVEHRISGSYVEFAERRVLDDYAHLDDPDRSQRRDGFDAGNADGIFESTYSNQTDKRE